MSKKKAKPKPKYDVNPPTKDQAQKFINALKHGLPLKTAAAAAGVSFSTSQKWRYNDPAFATAVEMARETGKAELVYTIVRLGGKFWQANAWLLERLYPSQFAKADKFTSKDVRQAMERFAVALMEHVPATMHEMIRAALEQAIPNK